MARHTPEYPFTHTRVSLAIPGAGLCLALVSDTHGAPHPETLPLLEKLAPHGIVHAGDIGRLDVLDELARVAPVRAVRGNIDGRAPHTPDALTVTLRGDDGTILRVFVTHIALRGPRVLKRMRERAAAESATLLVCGHSHVPYLGRDGSLTVFNPGSCGPRRFGLPSKIGLLRIDETGASLRHLSCETGEEWSP